MFVIGHKTDFAEKEDVQLETFLILLLSMFPRPTYFSLNVYCKDQAAVERLLHFLTNNSFKSVHDPSVSRLTMRLRWWLGIPQRHAIEEVFTFTSFVDSKRSSTAVFKQEPPTRLLLICRASRNATCLDSKPVYKRASTVSNDLISIRAYETIWACRLLLLVSFPTNEGPRSSITVS